MIRYEYILSNKTVRWLSAGEAIKPTQYATLLWLSVPYYATLLSATPHALDSSEKYDVVRISVCFKLGNIINFQTKELNNLIDGWQ